MSMKLKYVAYINMGQSPDQSDVNQLGVGVPFLQGKAEFGTISPQPINYCTKGNKFSKKNDILMSVRAPVGALNLSDQQYVIGRGLCSITAKSIDSDYLWYVLHEANTRLLTFVKGSTFEAVTTEDVKNLELNIIENQVTQRKVGNYLNYKVSEIENLISKKLSLIKLLEQQRQSIITEAITKGLNPNVKMKDSGVEWIGEIPWHWEVKKVKHFATHVGSGKTPNGGSEVYLDEGVPFLRSLNVHFDGIRLKNLAYISEETNEEMKNSQVQPLDLLLNITGASIGRTAIVPKHFGKANVNQHVCIIRINQSKAYPYYFNLVMSSDVINQQIWFSQNGSSREGLNFVQVKELILAIPPTLDEQKEINEWVYNKQSEIYSLIDKVNYQIEKIKQYRQSLIYEAVTGKIDVRDLELD